MGDGTTSASKVVGSINFKRPPIVQLDEAALRDKLQVRSSNICRRRRSSRSSRSSSRHGSDDGVCHVGGEYHDSSGSEWLCSDGGISTSVRI